jgi:hypothetical protein
VILLIAMLAARVAIEGVAISPAELQGGALAAIAWIFGISKMPKHDRMAAAIFVVFVILDALRPFHFLARPRSFHWVPFLGFMEGPRESGSRVFLLKTYIYGSLVWLLARTGLSYSMTAIAAAGLVLTLRFIQVYLPGRSAEIGDAIMVLILAAVMALLEPRRPARPVSCPP